jgi:hypothetical protein
LRTDRNRQSKIVNRKSRGLFLLTGSHPERRRSSCIAFKARVILSGKDAEGFSSAVKTETIGVSKHGALLRTSYNLKLGQELSVRTKEKDRFGQFQVAWKGKAGTSEEGMIGLEWLDPRRFWNVEFPPEDWQSA